MSSINKIEHNGFIQSIENNIIKVNIVSESACASCHAKGFCTSMDSKEKIIDISNYQDTYKTGENVKIIMEQSLGLKAVFFSYFLPFIILLISLIILMEISKNELFSGLLSIAILIPYFIVLYMLRDKFQKIFKFRIEKIV